MSSVVLPGLLAAGALGYAAFTLARPELVRTVVAAPRSGVFPGRLRVAWPGEGEAAVVIEGVGLIGAHDASRPAPIASIAKVMTAYVVLRDHPLRGGGSGRQIAVTPSDVAVYAADVASGQSVVPVQAGERLTERQALEGLLLSSGNNIATLLARWDAGDEGAFVAKMNAVGRALGLAHTRYTSASGVKASTVSTALDQVRLAVGALRVQALARIVAMPQATLPVVGRRYNENPLLGKDGIVGVKPGTTSEAGGCLLFVAHEHVDGRLITVVGAVLGQAAGQPQPTMIAAAANATAALLADVRGLLHDRVVLKRRATLAWVNAPWAHPIAVQVAGPVSLIGWPGLQIHTTITTANVHAPLHNGQVVGTAVIRAGNQRRNVRLVSSRALPEPSLIWRLTHP